jgi:hypothetical protein
MLETDNILVCDLSKSRDQEDNEHDREDASKIKYKIIACEEFQSDKAVTRKVHVGHIGEEEIMMDEEGLKNYILATASLKKIAL